jgi:L-fuconolactonase
VPDFPIVDAHVHLYDPNAVNFDWMASVPALNSKHLPVDFDRAAYGVEVDTMVFVEVNAAAGEHLLEAAWISGVSALEPRLRGIVASMPLSRGSKVESDLQRYATLPLARGVRQLIEVHLEEPGWCFNPSFLEGMALLPKYNLSFDLCLFHPQVKEVTELCRLFPDQHFVVDHVAKPGIRAGHTQPWADDLTALAKLPNVMCKISGLTTEADRQSWREADVSSYIQHAVNCFGFDRVMFGSDWPVSSLATSYARWVDLVDTATTHATHSEKRRLFRDNAISFYRLKV